MRRRKALTLLALAAAPLLPVGCLGPRAVQETRSAYNETIRANNNEELLLNIVRMRYGDDVGFLPVTGLTAQFEFTGGLGTRLGTDRGGSTNYGDAQLGYADRPTISFAPQRSAELTKGLLSQISLEALYLFAANGNNLERLLRLFVSSINGIDSGAAPVCPSDSPAPACGEFVELARQIAHLRSDNSIILGVESRSSDVADAVPLVSVSPDELVKIRAAGYGVRALDGKAGYRLSQTRTVRVLRINPDRVDSEGVRSLVRLLHLPPGALAYPIEERAENQFHPAANAAAQGEIAMTTRSVLEVMRLMAGSVDVPPERPCLGGRAESYPDIGDLFRVRSGKSKPAASYAAVHYRGIWFWIDDADASSKETLGLFSELFRLQRIGAAEGQPLLTLPVGR